MKLASIVLAITLASTPAHATDWSRPSAWCGWFMRTIQHVADPAYNRALQWLHWGAPSGPRVGAVVVWSRGRGKGHVGIIRGGPDAKGRWLVESGNDGHAVRTRYRSVSSAVGFRYSYR